MDAKAHRHGLNADAAADASTYAAAADKMATAAPLSINPFAHPHSTYPRESLLVFHDY